MWSAAAGAILHYTVCTQPFAQDIGSHIHRQAAGLSATLEQLCGSLLSRLGRAAVHKGI